MPLFKGKMREEEDSDSDESFHCCGRPEDLLEEFRSSMEIPKPDGNEVRVPDDQEYYLYSAGLERLNSPDNGPKRASCSSIHAIPRCSTVYSSDSDRTRVASPLLIIKTDDVVSPPSSPEMRTVRFQPVEASQPSKPKKSKWKIQIARPQSFLRLAISPTDDRPPSPEPSTAQASALDGQPPSASSLRRRGMVFTPSNLPEQLKELAETEDLDGSGT
ncbi:hypothetical protein PTTG_06779 [Puccinia triticina 1-1 BBBD Race 1]|uniref:Uncharacterized protein n=2 Tax=Puccinia triticina TaxID=208348 RepID=A0A0C4F109_PUCT1|nr:uncharacterized protein PtA15_4A690 [Puccinia triticina]OAV93725.1 hypothetical protein PTTG_06779 [Puccinia triticina 1-1 BBBD Race 1]WAQ84237.1 hypothetical protein PtA15_4A690 [Puccinia triticina]WAR55065.1 hypothetical protein PtB15_4B684 [Puccinia triticina]